jgi:hypothetical protein
MFLLPEQELKPLEILSKVWKLLRRVCGLYGSVGYEEEKAACAINNRKPPSISDFTGSKQSDRRAVTPQGCAKAFFIAICN